MLISYDFHIHSCLSPCGDDEMTPNNIVQISKLIGLDAIAVADHNSAKNLPAICALGQEIGITVVPAMEICSAEEVHILCLFETLQSVLDCSEEIYKYLPLIKNKVEYFGKQQILNTDDVEIDTEPLLLINALTLSLDDLLPLVRGFGAIIIPAHIDKSSTSIISSLGCIPSEYNFSWVECKNKEFAENLGFAEHIIINSDAHSLGTISEPVNFLNVADNTIQSILKALKNQ